MGRSAIRIFVSLIWIVPVAIPLIWGWDYYASPITERAYSDLHDLLKPSGTIGLGFGIFGTLFIVAGVGMYILRKRIPWLDRLGKLGPWLQLHIYFCSIGPVLVLFHTGFRLGGIIAIGFWCMIVVVLTGFLGRFFYTRIPASIQGRAELLASLRKEQADVITSITNDFGPIGAEIERVLQSEPLRRPRGLFHALVLTGRQALGERRRLLRLRDALSLEGARARGYEAPDFLRETLIALVRHRVALERKIVLVTPFQAVFKVCHIMHVPLTLVMGVIVTAHIALAILLGYTWIF